MIWEQKSTGIVMLNKLLERGQVKCHQYWPSQRQHFISSNNSSTANNSNNDLNNHYDLDHRDSNFELRGSIEMSEVGLRLDFVSEEKFQNYLVRDFDLTDVVSFQKLK